MLVPVQVTQCHKIEDEKSRLIDLTQYFSSYLLDVGYCPLCLGREEGEEEDMLSIFFFGKENTIGHFSLPKRKIDNIPSTSSSFLPKHKGIL